MTTRIRYVCKYCKNSYQLPTELIQHKKLEHAEEVAEILARFRANQEEKKTNLAEENWHNLQEEEKIRPANGNCIKTDTEGEETSSVSASTPIVRNPFECRFCHKILRRIGERIMHEKVHSGHKPYKCKKCQKSFAWKCSLHRHLRKKQCKIDAPKLHEIASKLNGRQRTRTKSKQNYGIRSISKLENIKNRRINVHTSVKQEGSNNVKKFPRNKFKRYREHRLESSETVYRCIFCLNDSSNLLEAITHGKTHRATEPVFCSYPNCGSTFSRMDSLECHVQRCHIGLYPFSCPICKQQYPTLTELKRHQRRSKTCPWSESVRNRNVAFKSKSTTTSYKTEKKIKKKKIVSSQPNLNRKRSQQNGNLKLASPLSLSSSSSSFIDPHLTVSFNIEGNTEYSCTVCNAKFSGRHAYQTARIHTVSHNEELKNGKKFECTKCGKCYNRKENLISHQSSHTGEKPYACEVCGTSYRWKSALRTCRKAHLVSGLTMREK